MVQIAGKDWRLYLVAKDQSIDFKGPLCVWLTPRVGPPMSNPPPPPPLPTSFLWPHCLGMKKFIVVCAF